MNKGGYSAPQYRSNDYRSYPGPSRYQPYHPPERFDSRQRSMMHQSDYYPDVNYPRRPDLRDELPPFPRGRGRERDFAGGQSYTPNRPSPGPPPPQVPPPINSPYREYSRMNPHPPPPSFMNGSSSNPLNPPNHPHHSSTPPSGGTSSAAAPSTSSTPSSHSHHQHANTLNHPPTAHPSNLLSAPHSTNNNNVHSPSSHPTSHPSSHLSGGHPPSHSNNTAIHHSGHPTHISGSHPSPHPPPNPSPNLPSTPNYPRERPPADYQPMRDYFSPRDSPKTPPYRMMSDLFRPIPREYSVMEELSNPSPFGMNSPPCPQIHIMPQKSPTMAPFLVLNTFTPPVVPPFPPNVGIPDDQKKKIEQTYSEYLKLFEEEKDVEGKKENYEILCHKIESIQAKLDAIASKLVDLEGDKQTNDDA